MNPNDHPLLVAIRQGESKTLEYKAELPKGDQLAKTLIAFANGSGGKLVIGVDDKQQLIGLKGADIFDLRDAIAQGAYTVQPQPVAGNLRRRRGGA
jgi:ATP-dependent DNA helicase RecG